MKIFNLYACKFGKTSIARKIIFIAYKIILAMSISYFSQGIAAVFDIVGIPVFFILMFNVRNKGTQILAAVCYACLLYTSPSPRD